MQQKHFKSSGRNAETTVVPEEVSPPLMRRSWSDKK